MGNDIVLEELDYELKPSKSKKCQFLLYPRIHDGLKEYAHITGISVNELTNQILERFLNNVRKQI